MSRKNPQKKLPRLTRIYDAGSVLRVRFTLNIGRPNESDMIDVRFYPGRISPDFFGSIFDEKALLFAHNKFQHERKAFLERYYPERFEEVYS